MYSPIHGVNTATIISSKIDSNEMNKIGKSEWYGHEEWRITLYNDLKIIDLVVRKRWEDDKFKLTCNHGIAKKKKCIQKLPFCKYNIIKYLL